MNTIAALFGTDIGVTTMIAFALVMGGAATLLAYGVSTLLSSARDPIRRRLAETVAVEEPRRAAGGRAFDFTRFVDRFGKYVLPNKASERDSVQKRLMQAGLRSPSALRNFYGIKAALAVGLPVALLIGTRWAPQLTTSTVGVLVAAVALVGVRLPDMVLGSLRDRRVKRLRNGFPDALDLLVVCVESGLGLTPAIERVARELEISHSDLAMELGLVNAEIRAGVERPTALRNLASRTGVEDIGGLVGLLAQTIRFGTSVAEALRVYSEEFRDRRMQRAEEQAAKIGTKMIFPLVACFFPSFFIVAVGPAAIRIVTAFQSM